MKRLSILSNKALFAKSKQFQNVAMPLIQANTIVAKKQHQVTQQQRLYATTTTTAAAKTDMFCMQCEQTKEGKGCTTVGVCGKTPEVAAMQGLHKK